MELPIADYNRLISARILDGYEKQINVLPQPQMLGGKRMRNFVLAGTTESDYPATLAVGRMDNEQPRTLGAEYFYKDFGKAFDRNGPNASIGSRMKGEGRKRSASESSSDEEMDGGVRLPKGKAVLKGLKKFGKASAPVAKELGMLLAKEGIKEGVKYGAKSASSGAGRKKKGGVMDAHILPVDPAKRGTRGPRAPKLPKGMPDLDGGALLRNDPAEYHSSVYPPALASYNAQMPIGSRGSGRKKSAPAPAPKAKRSSARGKIVSEVMKKKGLSLAEASKYVKEYNLY